MSDLNDNPATVAKAMGLKAVLPGHTQLLLDIDNDADHAWMTEQIACMAAVGFTVEILSDHPSKSGLPRRHVYIDLSMELSATERIAWQACLGSDRRRELLSMLRVKHRDISRPPTVLFERVDFEEPKS